MLLVLFCQVELVPGGHDLEVTEENKARKRVGYSMMPRPTGCGSLAATCKGWRGRGSTCMTSCTDPCRKQLMPFARGPRSQT